MAISSDSETMPGGASHCLTMFCLDFEVVSFHVSKNANYNPLKMKKMETGFRKLTATTCCQAALLN